jgi:N-acylneuraminate cytidylyltransferase
MLEVAERTPFDVMALVQATSPLTQAQDFVAARQHFVESAVDSLVTGVATHRFFWSSAGGPLNYQPAQRPRRQDMAPSYVENGAFYFTRRSVLLEQRCRLGGRIGVHPMSPDTLTEIDEPEDWPVVECLLRRRTITERLCRLQVLVVDVDGTLTDGGMYYGAEGERLKRFNTRDAKGLALLAGAGVRVCVMTGERSPAVDARMRKLGIRDYFPGTADKRELLEKYLAELALEPETAGVIGDDVADLEAMQLARVSFCPADAVAAVQAQADYVCSAAGGQGAVREVCDLILQARAATDPQQAS